MKFKIDLDPTPTRAIVIGVLLFFQALLVPLLADLLSNNAFPSFVKFVAYIITASLVLITYFLTFLHTGETEPT